MQDFSEAMLRALWKDNPDPTAILLTLDAPGLAEPILVTDWPGELDDDTKRGLVSDGDTYLFAPFNFALGGAGAKEPVRDARVAIANGSGEIGLAIRTVTAQPTIEMRLVRPSAPDTVEMAMTGAILADAEIDGPVVTGTIRPREFATEPLCKARMTISRVPGLF